MLHQVKRHAPLIFDGKQIDCCLASTECIAGIASGRIVSEPQVSALYCRRQRVALNSMHQQQQSYLTTSTFAIFCTFNDSWQIQHLDLGSSVVHHSRNACQGCKFISCHLSHTSNRCQVLSTLLQCTLIPLVGKAQVDSAGPERAKLHQTKVAELVSE